MTRAYYFLPGIGIYGGIKVGFQLVATLRALGVSAVVVTPDGRAPQWFPSTVPVVAEADAVARVRARDLVLFSLPHDYTRLAALPGRLVFHCQGTDPRIDPIVDDRRVALLACWPQAHAYMRARGRADVRDVGIVVAAAFFYGGRPKYEGVVAAMPRRGAEIVAACRRRVHAGRMLMIDGLAEPAVADRMQRADVYLATSVGEWFGLPALEAMAAGCVVLSVPVVGGTYLEDGRNGLVVAPEAMPDVLADVLAPSRRPLRARLRAAARATAGHYRASVAATRVRAWLATLVPSIEVGA